MPRSPKGLPRGDAAPHHARGRSRHERAIGSVAVSDAREGPDYSGAKPGFDAEAALAHFLLRQRRRREEMLGAEHSADPVWDIMLDLFAARVRGEEVAVSSLIIAASVPQSTALRHIRRLVRDGLLVARDDPQDGRRTFVRLSDGLFERVAKFLQQYIVASREHHMRR